MTDKQEIPNKLYFRIGEVSDLVGVRPYVLRYWESEFPDIKPSKSKSGQRLYKRRDVETLVRIKQLLYEERFTIDGAKKKVKELGKPEDVKEIEKQNTSAPKQLEVFSDSKVVSEDRKKTRDRSEEHEHNEKHSDGNKKIFIKIKRDLEHLLTVLRN
ncbi:MAG: MerR family transcriptional regulator [Deltaproteobacteria bacterium CG07_land_8_20_14_0_80_38_7]|nr:MAG: MerR family transcriptional regulator [Deltaproteobacteria bacterium CG07_land_8_20_14_0_80_38_7]